MDEQLFSADDTWNGGFYELAMEVGPHSDENLQAALTALWSHLDLDGCYEDRNREPGDQPRLLPKCLESGTHLLGVARLPNGSRVACGSCLHREGDDGSDWLDFYLPTGALGTVYPCGSFPFGDEADWSGPWRYEVEDWLAGVGLWVARSATFQLGLIGFEVSGCVHAADITEQGIPTGRAVGYLRPQDGSMQYFRRSRS